MSLMARLLGTVLGRMSFTVGNIAASCVNTDIHPEGETLVQVVVGHRKDVERNSCSHRVMMKFRLEAKSPPRSSESRS